VAPGELLCDPQGGPRAPVKKIWGRPAFPKWVPWNPRVPWTNLKSSTGYTDQFEAKSAEMSFNPLGMWQPL